MRTTICKKCGAKIDATLGICPFCGTTFQVEPADEASREKDKELEWAMSMEDEPLPGYPENGCDRGHQPDGYDSRNPRAQGGYDRSSYDRDPRGYGQQPDRTGAYGRDDDPYPGTGSGAPQGGGYGRNTQQSTGYGANQPPAGGYGRQGSGANQPASFGIGDIENANNDELFNTRVWRPTDDPDATRAVGTERRAAPPVSRDEIHRAPREQETRRPVRETQAAAAARAQAEEEERKAAELHKKKLFVTVVAMIAGLTLLLSIIGGVFNFGKNTGGQSMPNVIGYMADTAKNVLEHTPYDLKVTVKTESSDKTKDTVLEQSIEEGKKVQKGEVVTLTVSDGTGTDEPDTSEATDYADVPDLSGKTYEQATALLKARDLHIARNDDVYSDQDAGKIVAQNPMKGAKLQKGSLVTVTVSKGQMVSPSPTSHSITVTAGKGGSVSPKGSVSVADGKNQTFTFAPSSGYKIKEVKVDGKNIGAVDSYTFPPVTENHTLYVVFEKAESAPPTPSDEAPQTSEEVAQP